MLSEVDLIKLLQVQFTSVAIALNSYTYKLHL